MTNLNARLTMKPTSSFSALLAAGFCIYLTVQVGESQHVPARCLCPKSKSRAQGPFSDFSVTLPRPGCGEVEIIVTLEKDNRPVCLSPQGHQGKRLLKCWTRKRNEGGDEKKCIGRLKRRTRKRRRQMAHDRLRKARSRPT